MEPLLRLASAVTRSGGENELLGGVAETVGLRKGTFLRNEPNGIIEKLHMKDARRQQVIEREIKKNDWVRPPRTWLR